MLKACSSKFSEREQKLPDELIIDNTSIIRSKKMDVADGKKEKARCEITNANSQDLEELGFQELESLWETLNRGRSVYKQILVEKCQL